MPTAEEAKRGGVVRYRTVRVGKGKRKRYIHIAVVRKAGKRGGHTVAGTPKTYKRGAST
jgi:hypothetical protein